MRRLAIAVLGLAFLASVGCEKGTSTASSTDPNKPQSNRKLSVTSPGEQTVTQDKTDEFTVSINRDNFTGPVDLDVRDLPKGVELVTKEMAIPADKSSMTVTVKAAPNAEPKEDHVVTIAAKARDQKDMPEATTTFKLDVKSK